MNCLQQSTNKKATPGQGNCCQSLSPFHPGTTGPLHQFHISNRFLCHILFISICFFLANIINHKFCKFWTHREILMKNINSGGGEKFQWKTKLKFQRGRTSRATLRVAFRPLSVPFVFGASRLGWDG